MFVERDGVIQIGGARLRGIADRIDIRADSGAEIIDYKTGQPPTSNSGKKPVLRRNCCWKRRCWNRGPFLKLDAR